MQLMIDIGNTNIVLGLYNNEKLEHTWRQSSQYARTEDESWISLNSFFELGSVSSESLNGVAISSVVPELTLTYSRMIDKYVKIKPLLIGPDLDLGLKILYQDPYAVGADRICNAVAGKKKFGAPLIILDFGTATTFDCLDDSGDYLGGIICPGIESAATILHRKAAKLPKIDLRFPQNLIGRNTEESMQSGIMHGSVKLIEGLVDNIKNELGKNAKVVATGGMAYYIASETDHIDFVEEYLNIEGIYLIYLRNSAKS
jgi:type III pantothenate kinase